MKPKLQLIILAILITFIQASPVSAGDMDLDTGRHPWTPMADISNTIKNSGRYDYHVTYFDPDKAIKAYEESRKYADENQVLSPGNNGNKIADYALNVETKLIVDHVKSLLSSGEGKVARKAIEKLQKADPDYWKAETFMGRAYMLDGNYPKALEHFKTAIKRNRIDFDAYRWSGQCRMKMGEYDKARHDFIMAIICNRNDPGAWKSLSDLGKIAGFTLYTEPFVPLYNVEKMDNGTHRIYMDKDTLPRQMPYSFCKAYWRYEPGYFKKRIGEEKYRRTFIEEMECLRNLMWSYNAFKIRGQMKDDPYLERLAEIKNRFFLKQFVYFDVLSPQDPQLMAAMDEKYIPDMLDYVNDFVIMEKPETKNKDEKKGH